MEQVLNAITWSELVCQIPPGESAKFPLKHKQTIRFEISYRISKKHPERMFKTWTDETTITVHRLTDKIC
jgi:hypothetical protein